MRRKEYIAEVVRAHRWRSGEPEMKVKEMTVAILALLAAAWAFAGNVDISGTWQVKTTSPLGTAQQIITFQQSGDSFSGVMLASDGTKQPIKDGKVNGDEIEFNVLRKRPTGEISTVPYKGKVKGKAITGTFVGATGRNVDWTATRQ